MRRVAGKATGGSGGAGERGQDSGIKRDPTLRSG